LEAAIAVCSASVSGTGGSSSTSAKRRTTCAMSSCASGEAFARLRTFDREVLSQTALDDLWDARRMAPHYVTIAGYLSVSLLVGPAHEHYPRYPAYADLIPTGVALPAG
jgi:hypothetical protein